MPPDNIAERRSVSHYGLKGQAAERNRSRAECEPTSPRHAGFSSLVQPDFFANVADQAANQSERLRERACICRTKDLLSFWSSG